jgi:spore coat protein H
MNRKMPLLFALVVWLSLPAWAQEPTPSNQDKEPKRKEKKTDASEADQLFQRDKVWTINLIVTSEEWKKIEPANTGGPGFGPPPNQARPVTAPGSNAERGARFGPPQMDFPEVRATFEFEGQTVGEIGLRYKGNSTYMAARDLPKKSFKVDFNQFSKKQKFFGLTKLNLNNNMLDSSQMREALSYELFRQAGVPASRTAFARVYLTVTAVTDVTAVTGSTERRYLGLYTLVEQVDERLLRRSYADDNGLLLKPQMVRGLPYLGEDWNKYVQPYEAKNDPQPAEARRFIALTKLVNEGSDEAFRSQIRSFMDVNAFLRFLAVNALLVNMDSILAMGQNYYIYHDISEDQFHWIPWDLNMSFGGFPSGTTEQMLTLSLLHPHAGEHKLIDRLLAVPEIKTAYLGQLKEISAKIMRADYLNDEIEKLKQAIRPAIVEESLGALTQFDRAMAETIPAQAGPERVTVPLPNPDGPGRRGPGMGLMGMGGTPLKPFIARRISSVQEQLAGKSEGYTPQFGGPGGSRGGPGGFPGGLGGFPGGPDGPGSAGRMLPFGGLGFLLAPGMLLAADGNQDGKITKNELAAASKVWFRAWDTAKRKTLDAEALGNGLRQWLGQGLGQGPGVLPFSPDMPPSNFPGGPRPGMAMGRPNSMLAQAFLRTTDANKDGKLSAPEFNGAFAKWFGQWDADKSVTLNEAELRDGLSQLFRPPDFNRQAESSAVNKAENKAALAPPKKRKARQQ